MYPRFLQVAVVGLQKAYLEYPRFQQGQLWPRPCNFLRQLLRDALTWRWKVLSVMDEPWRRPGVGKGC